MDIINTHQEIESLLLRYKGHEELTNKYIQFSVLCKPNKTHSSMSLGFVLNLPSDQT